MNQQLSFSSFKNLQNDYYEEQNSDPSHFMLHSYDKDDTFGSIILSLTYQESQVYTNIRTQLKEEGICQKEQSSICYEENQYSSGVDQSSSNRHQIESSSSTNTKSNQNSNIQIHSKSESKSKKRIDNSNNAHKQFTTKLNDTCKDCHIFKELQKSLKQQNIPFNKSSRQAFIIKLLQIKLFYPQKGHTIMNNFLIRIKEDKNQGEKDAAALYLKNLTGVYSQAIKLFYGGKIIEATQCIYDIENAKEKAYKKQGIARVKKFMIKYNLDQ